MTPHELSYHIRGAAMEVYNTLGPGLLESVYHRAMVYELQSRGVKVQSEVPIEVYYKGELIEGGFRLDLLVEDEVSVELKSVDEILPIHFKQLKTYMKLTGKENGVLINFNAYDLSEGIRLVKLNLSDKK
jgi:GxxExxY protein